MSFRPYLAGYILSENLSWRDHKNGVDGDSEPANTEAPARLVCSRIRGSCLGTSTGQIVIEGEGSLKKACVWIGNNRQTNMFHSNLLRKLISNDFRAESQLASATSSSSCPSSLVSVGMRLAHGYGA